MMKSIFGALVALALVATAAQAGKEDDAKKYTNDLKTSKDVNVKITAIQEIGKLGQIKKSYATDALPYMIEACKDKKNAKLRAAAAEAIGKVDPPTDLNVVELLTDMAKTDKDTQVQIAAIRGLANMGPAAKSAIPALRELTSKDDKSPLSRAAMNAVRTIQNR